MVEAKFKRNPSELYEVVLALPDTTTHVFINEIQKVPELLDVVHCLMGVYKKKLFYLARVHVN